MKRRLFVFLTYMLCFTLSAFAQKTITGVVLDGAANNEPMLGVAIVIKGTSVSTQTDFDGKFSISTKDGDVLIFSFLGYSTREVVVEGDTPLAVVLEQDATLLDDIIVVGYGVQKKSDVTGAVASLNKDVLENRPAPNLVTALQGSIPGLKVELYGSDAEGSKSSTVIRGSNSINAGNAPLIILDGAPYYFSWSELNPDDIESIEVLKDASSAAIYGSRGANGVILITTKKGQSDKARVNYHGYMTVSDVYELPKMMDGDTFYYYKNEAVGDFTLTERNTFLSKNYVDWVGLALRTGLNHYHTISVSGKTKVNNYFVSFIASDNKGIAKGNDFTKYSGRINFEQDIGKWVKFSTNTQINFVDRSGHHVDFQSAYYMNPLAQAYNSDGSLRLQTWEASTDVANPLAELNVINSNIRRTLMTNNSLDVKFPIDGLLYRLSTNVQFDSRDENTYYGRDTYTGARNNGLLEIYDSYSSKWLVENILSYTKTFGKHSLFLTALYSAQHQTRETNTIEGSGFGSDVLTYWQPDKATALTASTSEWTKTHVSQMLRANYSFDSRYLMTLTVRNDGYSGFGEDRKYGLFPSVALGWNVVNEPFVKGTKMDKLFNQLKLRVSYGINGNEAIDPYATLPKLSTRNYLGDDYSSEFGYYPTKLESPLLGWEKTASFNIGLDYGMLANRISGTLDVYDARTTDLLLVKTIPSINGASSIWENIGKTHSYGIEFGLHSINISKKDFTWSTSFIIYANRTKLVDVGLYDENGNPVDDVASGYFLGWPTNCYYDYVFDGIWQIGEVDSNTPLHSQPGYVRYKDLDGDGDITPEKDQMVVGSREAKFDASLTNTFSYKNFSLSVYMIGRYGSLTPNYFVNSHTESYRINLYHRAFWSETYPINEYPSNTRDASSNPKRVRFYRSADFIKIKDVTLSYKLPDRMLQPLRLSKLEVYANMKNLFTFTNWVGLDPEFVGSSSRQRSIPQTRQYTLGLKVSF